MAGDATSPMEQFDRRYTEAGIDLLSGDTAGRG
jgi:hypothetical protein